MKSTYDTHIKGYDKLIPPISLKQEFPLSDQATATVLSARETVKKIISGEDKRMLAIVGPCSIHDEKAALDYANRLNELRKKVENTFFVIMRVYFEKPRTTIGWKGLINDPFLDGSCNIQEGLRIARKLLLDIVEMGIPVGTEILDPIIPQYIAGLVSWAAIGARTTESQTHREMASGLSMPVGFKNCTNGSLDVALNGMLASSAPQHFVGIDQKGNSCVVKTTGNPWGHLVLRGGKHPNYDPVSVADACQKLTAKNLPSGIVVDCSHDNSGKKYQGQAFVLKNVINQRIDGNENLIGLMLESNLYEGNQKLTSDPGSLRYGVSITDECISWETTEALLSLGQDMLSMGQPGSRTAVNSW
jgi:3-deoxy-7-phosphoheptulonate synthase